MSRRSSSVNRTDSGISRNIGSDITKVRIVADNIETIIAAAGVDLEGLADALEQAVDFTGITVLAGDTASWNAVDKILTVPTVEGDKGDKGEDLLITSVVPVAGGAFEWLFSDGTVYTTPSLRGDKGGKGDKGDAGDSVGITNIEYRGGGKFLWAFSDGTTYLTPSLRGVKGDGGDKGDKGDEGDPLGLDHIIYQGGGKFLWRFTDGSTYLTPDLSGLKGDKGDKGTRGVEGASVHHLRPTSTTDSGGAYGRFGERDTYTFYSDRHETGVLGSFTVMNGFQSPEDLGNIGIMTRDRYDTNEDGVVDNSTRLGGVTLEDLRLEVAEDLSDLGTLFTFNTEVDAAAASGTLTAGDEVYISASVRGGWAKYQVSSTSPSLVLEEITSQVANDRVAAGIALNTAGQTFPEAVNEIKEHSDTLAAGTAAALDTKLDKVGGTITGNLAVAESVTITGDLTVSGTHNVVNAEEVNTTDTLIRVNAGEVGGGVTAGFAGIEVDRGTSDNFSFGFEESAGAFTMGKEGERQAAATRTDLVGGNIPAWDSVSKTLVDSGQTAAEISSASAVSATSSMLAIFTPRRVREAVAAWWNDSGFKAKLDGVATGATKNSTDSVLVARSSHTGTQPVSTITGLGDAATTAVSTIRAGTTKANVGLGSVDNYSRADYDARYATKAQGTKADNAQPKVSGRGLSTNDYTTSEKTKLAGIAAGADVTDYVGIEADAQARAGAAELAAKNYTDGKVGTAGVKDLATTTEAKAGTTGKIPDVAGVHAAIREYIPTLNKEPYGLEWNQTADLYTRTGSGNYTQVQQRMRRCVLNTDRSVNYYLDSYDSTKKVDGSFSNLNGVDGNVMVEIPKFYYKYEYRTVNGQVIHSHSISEVEETGYSVHPAFVRNGVEVGYRYFAAYQATISAGKMQSISGAYPTVGKTRSAFRADAVAVGAGWHQLDFLLYEAVTLLCIIEYGTMDIQEALNRGRTGLTGGSWTGGSLIGINGLSNTLGNRSGGVHFAGSADDAAADSSFMSYRGIENLFGNVWTMVDGLNVQDNIPYLNQNPSTYVDDVFNGDYVSAGVTMANSNGYSRELANSPSGFFPSSVSGGASNRGTCDYYYQNTGSRIALVGGSSFRGAYAGPLSLIVNSAASHASVPVGSGISC